MDTNLKLKIEQYVNEIVRNSIIECTTAGYNQPNLKASLNCQYADNAPEDYTLIDEAAERLAAGRINTGGIERLAEKLVSDSIADGLKTVTRKKRILCVGIVCLDLITICDKYPEEDTETLVLDHYWARGGNASNSATVLANLGANSEFLGTLVNNRWLEFLENDFNSSGVCIESCVYLDAAKHKSPVATLILSRASGTRTALPDFKNVTELTFDQFDAIDLRKYDWIHFEGRPKSPDLEKMMSKIETYNDRCDTGEHITITVEIEQLHTICPELRPLFGKADVIFVSKDYAKDAGFKSKEDAVDGLYGRCKKGSTIICAWGENGATAKSEAGTFTSKGYPPECLVDTLGAGDTFNASVIYALHEGKTVDDAVVFGCRVAGTKCGMRGFAGTKGLKCWL